MRYGIARQVFVCLLALAVATAGVARVVRADNMHVAIAAGGMATDMPVHSKCSGCAGDEKGLASVACSVYCASVVALPAMPAATNVAVAEVLRPSDQLRLAGLAAPPDPYPPRTIILS
ncbi:MAG TPA: hypothetical protein VFL49_02940 [Pseudolabrys sp.]|nr:hypothetical protein [Pseudolabrys sp.]